MLRLISLSRRIVVASIFATAVVSLPASMHASPRSADKSVSKAHVVHVTLRNKTSQALDLVCGDKPFTIAANADYKLDAPEGTIVYAADRTTAKLQVTRDLNGSIASFR